MLVDIIKSMNNPKYTEAISRVCLKYNISEKETLEQIIRLVLKINLEKSFPIKFFQAQNQLENFQYWGLGELKAFRWILVFYCCYFSIEIIEFSQDQFQQIQTMFPLKSVSFIKYEAYCIHKNSIKNQRLWNQQENIMLQRLIMQNDQTINWRRISFHLFQKSKHLYFRSFSQCRQQWINHLDPKIQNKKWSIQEDITLFTLVELNGSKWSKISKEIGSKNQHMVKNRYNSYINKFQSKREGKKYFIDQRILPFLKQISDKQNQQITKITEVQQHKNMEQIERIINSQPLVNISVSFEQKILKGQISYSNEEERQDIDKYLQHLID